jgi:hypothetical protein
MVTALQRAGGALNTNVHFHTLVLDGVFTEDPEGALTFHPAPGPSDAEVAAALTTIRHRVQRLLVRHGLEPADHGGFVLFVACRVRALSPHGEQMAVQRRAEAQEFAVMRK